MAVVAVARVALLPMAVQQAFAVARVALRTVGSCRPGILRGGTAWALAAGLVAVVADAGGRAALAVGVGEAAGRDGVTLQTFTGALTGAVIVLPEPTGR